jgi:ubiquinone/menaquinone biosynthesis C-methylase UbiE
MIYDRFPEVYDRLLSPIERSFLGRWRIELIKSLPIEGPILEIGAGTGLNFEHYGNGSDITATDLSIAMLRKARGRSSLVKIAQADAENIPFGDDQFSASVGTLILCSVENPNKVFSELKRVVRNGGSILFLEHVRPEGFLGPVFDVLNVATSRLIGDCVNRRTEELLSDFGFDVISVIRKSAGIVKLIHCKNNK